MRKSIFATFTAAVAVAAALLLTGCERAINMTGRPVSFAAGISDGASGPKTRVAYGEISGEEGSKKQPLEWKVNDLITIYCAQCESKKSADYKVTEVESLKANLDSYASIVNAESDGIGLQWGTGNHTFYAVYPKTDGTGTTINGKDITGVIPATQGFTEVSGTDDQIVAPDMKNMYMVSKAGTYEPDASPVTLVFQPLSTALEFTITNKFEDTESAMIVNSISLVSTGHALSGGFAVDMNQNGSYGRPKTTLASGTTVADNNTVTIDFGEDPVTVAYDGTLNFTFFLNPGNEYEVDDLIFVINGTNAGNSETFTRRAKLEYKTGDGVTFKTHQKTIINGLMVPEGVEWTINYDQIVVTSWDSGVTDNLELKEPETEFEYVDLGLSVLWATYNIGAAEPEEYGKYFAWGDVEGRTPATDGTNAFAAKPFSWKNTPFNNGEEDIDANYFNAHKSEWITGVNTLKPEYDAASVNWGDGWRMPTKSEFDELIAKTNFEYTSDFESTGVCGYVFTSKKDANKSIFLPIANYGNAAALVSGFGGGYWSSSLNTVISYPQRAYYLQLVENVGVSSPSNNGNGRYYGYSVRPVKEKPLPEGALRGLFSVSATEQVHFSKGNLYCIDKGSGTSPRYEFNFESKQYDFRLRNAAGNSSMKDGNSYTVPANESGMFQWNKGNAVNGSDYGAFTTGSPTGDASDHVDWGNAMSNGDKWHTLNSDQWSYLVQRKSSTGKPLVSWALVGEIEGLVLAPDYYKGFDSNHFEWTLSQWQSYESDGFVFLPACGFLSLSQTSMHQSINDAFYMTSDAYDSGHAYIICAVYSADSEFQPAVGNASRNAAHPVRLVTYAD